MTSGWTHVRNAEARPKSRPRPDLAVHANAPRPPPRRWRYEPVRAQKAAPPRPQQRSGARGNVSIADRTSSTANPSSQSPQAVSIRAELIGSDCCSALGIAAYCSAPVLTLCRKLVEAGNNSATPLEVWRRDTLALSVRSIGEGAKLEASPRGVGFVHRPDVRGGSLVAQNGVGPGLPEPSITGAA